MRLRPALLTASLTALALTAAMAAPSAGNEQPWAFVVIRDKATLDKVHAFHPYAGPLRTAALGILVCGDVSREKYKGYWIQDCSAATENILCRARTRLAFAICLPRESRHGIELKITIAPGGSRCLLRADIELVVRTYLTNHLQSA